MVIAMVTPPRAPTQSYESVLLGELLVRAGLLSKAQLEIALDDQQQYANQCLGEHLLLGQILALRGWIRQETADFFAVRWPQLIRESPKHKIGDYLQEAGLITAEQKALLICEQNFNKLRLGTLAVLKGWIKQRTLDFFLAYLYPEEQYAGHWMRPHVLGDHSTTVQGNQTTQVQDDSAPSPAVKGETDKRSWEMWLQEDTEAGNNIHWID